MNIVKLVPEQQTLIVNSAVKILRERMLGNVRIIDTIHQEFLGFKEEDVELGLPRFQPHHTREEKEEIINKSHPIEVEVISVMRAVEKAVREVIGKERAHIEKPSVGEHVGALLGERVLQIFNSKYKERIALPSRFAETIAQRMKDNDREIQSHEYQIFDLLKEYFLTEDKVIKNQLFGGITQGLTSIHELSEKNKRDEALYDLSSLYAQDHISDEEDQETKFSPGDIFAPDGGLETREPVVDADFRLEMEHNMKLSESERALVCYLPREMEHDTRIISETYYWITYGEEWQRESFEIKSIAPKEYLQMLERILMRKLIIYSHSEQRLLQEEARLGKGGVDKKSCDKIRDYLPNLDEEIIILSHKIKTIKNENTATKKTKTSPSGMQLILEGTFLTLKTKYRKALKQFFEIGNYSEIEKLHGSLVVAYGDLESHCLKNELRSDLIGTAETTKISEGVEGNAGILTIDEYLAGPDYFMSFPSELLAPKSESEAILSKACQIQTHPLFHYNDGGAPIHFIYREKDGAESSDLEKMKLLQTIISDVIERKMSIYFSATQWMEDDKNEEVDYYKHILENEILSMGDALLMLSRRIRWENSAHQKYPELQAEMDYLAQCRNNLLGEFVGAEDFDSRDILGGKILAYTDAMAWRNKELSQSHHPMEKPQSHITTEPLSASEGGLSDYIPISVRKSESILFGRTIPYFGKEEKIMPDHAWEKKKIHANLHLERKMLIYFFALRRISEIDEEVMSLETNQDDEIHMLERNLIEEKSRELYQEILDLIEKIRELDIYSLEQAEHESVEEKSEFLINKATALHGELDGILAQTDDDFSKKVEHYWYSLQRYILRFRTRVILARENGQLNTVPDIQAEFDNEMHYIILDMQNTLKELKTSGKKTAAIVSTVKKIRKDLFGNTDNG